VHPPCKNLAQQEDRLPVPVRSEDTVSTTILHSEEAWEVMGCGQPVGLNSDANELRGLVATIGGVWITEDGHLVTDLYDAQQEASFSFFSMLKNGDTVAELILGWTKDSGEEVYNFYQLVYRFCRTTRGEATKKLVITRRSKPEQRELEVDRCLKAKVSSVNFHKAFIREEIASYAPSTLFLQEGRKINGI
jgi:hypothetical protein